MKSISLLSAILPLAAAVPASVSSSRAFSVPSVVPSNVKVVGVSLLGSGCPAGTADVQIDATKTLLEVTFSEYVVQTGPGTKAADWRKNCSTSFLKLRPKTSRMGWLTTRIRAHHQPRLQ